MLSEDLSFGVSAFDAKIELFERLCGYDIEGLSMRQDSSDVEFVIELVNLSEIKHDVLWEMLKLELPNLFALDFHLGYFFFYSHLEQVRRSSNIEMSLILHNFLVEYLLHQRFIIRIRFYRIPMLLLHH